MPNYCFNCLRLTHNDPAMITRVIEAFRANRLLREFLPPPKDELNPDDADGVSCDWTNAHWGTKWEVESSGGRVESFWPDTVALDFDTANNPPLPFYDCLRGLGFKVHATWAELGCRFCGAYTDAGVVHRYDIPFTEDECRANVPENIDADFGISDYVAAGA